MSQPIRKISFNQPVTGYEDIAQIEEAQVNDAEAIAEAARKSYLEHWLQSSIAKAPEVATIEAVSKKGSIPQLPPTDKCAGAMNERELQKLLFFATKAQKEIAEEHRQHRMDGIHLEHKEKKELHKQELIAKTEMSNIEKSKDTADTIGVVSAVVSIFALIGSVFAAVVTSGAALLIVGAVLQGAGGLAQAGAQISKTRFTAQLEELKCKLMDLREKGAAINSNTQDHLKETKAITSQLGNHDKAYREALDNALKAVQQIFN